MPRRGPLMSAWQTERADALTVPPLHSQSLSDVCSHAEHQRRAYRPA